MILENLIKKHLLLEKKISEIKANLIISYDLRSDEGAKVHTDLRKMRHTSQGGDRIYDAEIHTLVEKAKDEITFYIANGTLNTGIRFIVSEKDWPYLNVIIEPKMISYFHWELQVITVMRKEDFRVRADQVHIFV